MPSYIPSKPNAAAADTKPVKPENEADDDLANMMKI